MQSSIGPRRHAASERRRVPHQQAYDRHTIREVSHVGKFHQIHFTAVRSNSERADSIHYECPRSGHFDLACDELALWGVIDHKDSEIGTLDSEIGTLKAENERYRVALSIDQATPSALLKLTNKELQAKAANVVAHLREINTVYVARNAEINAQTNPNETARRNRTEGLQRELGERFVTEVRSDAFNVDFELRRRLGPKAVAGIVGITPSIAATDGTRINILQLIPSDVMPAFHLGFLSTFADGIEQMAKLLPQDG